MLQIVFSDSECGSLKLATHWGPSSWDDGPIGFIFGDGEREPTQEEKDQAMAQLKAQWEAENRRARPVGGDPGDVLCPSVGLDIGPISGPDVERARFDLLTASGNTKVANSASNLASLATFALAGKVMWSVGIPAALCGIAGNYIGSGLALKGGARIIRPMFFVVLALLLVRLIYGLFA